MIVSAIAAMDRAGLIGNGPKMSWHLPRDLKRFREYTLKKPIIMGRRTLESLASPLPGRLNIILTRNSTFQVEGCRIAHSVEAAFTIAQQHNEVIGGNEVMVIGGGDVFKATVSLWDRLYLTVVEGDFAGDTFFPLEEIRDIPWQLITSEVCETDVKNRVAHSFLAFERLQTYRDGQEQFDLFHWLSDPSLREALQAQSSL